MVERLKLVYIGAGSFRFSTPFFMDMAQMSGQYKIPIEVGLCDINPEWLNIAVKYFTRIAKKASRQRGSDIKITSSVDRTELMENADFIYKSISVGIQEAEWFDNYLPIKFGIPQNTGDTLGPGGTFRGLRCAPVGAAIAQDINKLCPKAPLLNYTNPQASIVMAARTVAPDVQYIGLCHELFGGMKTLQKWAKKYHNLKVPKWEDFDYNYAGINHFVWLTEFGYQGEDLYPMLREDAPKLVQDKFGRPFNFYLLQKHGWFPYPGSRHVAEFMTDYYNYFNHEVQTPKWSFPVIRDVAKLDRARKFAYKLMKMVGKGLFYVPPARNSGEKACEMTVDWYYNNTEAKHVVNLPNTGQKLVTNLPEDSVVEVPAHFIDKKITPYDPITLPGEVANLVRPHAEQTRYTVDAALGNDMELVVRAMKHDPMCQWIQDDDKIEYLTKLMLYYEQEWLPEEWKEWIPSQYELQKSKWWVAPKDLVRDNKEYSKVLFGPAEYLRKKAFFWE